ncbi:MAG: hypothetical protein PHP70_08415 [Gallionella sp.]|nr:hypothetical protein [Gallionella sp.]
MNEPFIVGKAVFGLDVWNDQEDMQAMVILHKDTHWLVLSWLEAPSTGKRTPERIALLEKFYPAVMPDGLIRLGLTVPKELFDDPCPPELCRTFAVEDYPVLAHIPVSSSTH